MAGTDHETGTVRSGDVTIFYRRFGARGGTPILIAHGANYYDSYDWIEVAASLATGREVVAYDTRGFGQSSWSAAKNYSHDANLADIKALIAHFDWRKTVFMGHSRGGGIMLLAASRLKERAAGLVLVDYCPSGGPAPARAGHGPARATVFPSLAAAQAAMSRDKDATTQARLDMILAPAEGGFVFRSRDPDFGSQAAATPGWTPEIVVGDMWRELAGVTAPTLIVRALRGTNYTHEIVERVRREFPHIKVIDVESGHDVAGGAPQALIVGLERFLADHIDR
jgi:pimeloyl-ACP methyl ester carboxylesterase